VSRPLAPAAVAVRARRASDTRAVRRVARAAWRATYGPIAPPGLIATVLRRGYGRERLLEGLVEPRRDALVAEVSGAVVGYADVFQDASDACELRRIYVAPAHQGHGAGGALLSAAVEAARGRGAGRLDVAVDRENARAVQWYERRGFARCGTSRFDVGPWSRPQVRLSLPLR
jgi:ribosomal protein S18 acetylase RimI-like enzyme